MSDLINEANRCVQCKNPSCMKGCPINTKIPQVIKLFREDKIDEAAEILFLNNPLSAFCAYVCNHSKQCYGNCILNKINKPIQFFEIEKYISTNYLKKKYQKTINTNKNIAIIGAGPAGLSAAIYLNEYSYNVTIYESKNDIGGMLRYGIPEFRLPKSIIDDFKHNQLEARNIQIKTNTTIGETITINDLLKQYDAVLLAMGLSKASTLNIKGEDLPNVHYGIDYLYNPDAYELGDNLIVIGAGNAAMDVARTAKRKGVKQVTCYARRNVSRSNVDELNAAISDGVKFEYSKMPIEITDKAVIFADTYTNEDNKAIRIENSEKEYPYSSVIISVSQSVLNNFNKDINIEIDNRGHIKTYEDGKTNIPSLFVSGDISDKSAGTVVGVVAHSKLVSSQINQYLSNK